MLVKTVRDQVLSIVGTNSPQCIKTTEKSGSKDEVSQIHWKLASRTPAAIVSLNGFCVPDARLYEQSKDADI